MAAANQALRDATGSLEFVSAESIARQYAQPRQQRPPRRPPDRRARRIGSSATPGSSGARRDRRTALPPDGLPAATRTYRRRGIGGAMLAWQERRMARARRRPSRRTAACVMRAWTYDARRGRRPAPRRPRLDRRGPRLRDDSGRPSTTIPARPAAGRLRDPRRSTAPRLRRVWDASAEAFRDERGEGEWTEADWDPPHRRPASGPDAVGRRVRRRRRGRRRPRPDRPRGERPPRRPAGVHRRRLDAPTVPASRAGAGPARPRPRPASASAA